MVEDFWNSWGALEALVLLLLGGSPGLIGAWVVLLHCDWLPSLFILAVEVRGRHFRRCVYGSRTDRASETGVEDGLALEDARSECLSFARCRRWIGLASLRLGYLYIL